MKKDKGKAEELSEQHLQAVEALKRSEERYALAQRAANIGSWDWDITTGELVWSERIEPMFGFAPGKFGATYEAFLDCVHPEDRQYVVDSVNACVEQGKDYAIEHRIVWPDGTVRWLSETGDVVRDKKGKAIRMLGVVQDITERKNTEQRQLLAGQILECLNQEVAGLEVIRHVLALIKDSTGFAAVGIRLNRGDDFPYFETKGFSEEFIRAENYLCIRDKGGKYVLDSQGTPVLECMCGSVLSGLTTPTLPFFTEGGSFWTNSTTELLRTTLPADLKASVRGRCNKAGYESVALIPLRSQEQIVGLLQLNDTKPGRFTPEMIRSFEGIGSSIGIALARIRAEEEIENLAKFPSENPNPVLRVAKDGTVLYANSVGAELLKEWDCKVGACVPEHWLQYVLRILKSGLSEKLETICCKDRIFSLIIAPVVDSGYVNMYGIDVTERKQAEEALQRSERELTIRNRIADIFLTISDDEVYGEILQVLLDTMESKYGIFGYIDKDGVLIIPSMTREIWKECQIPDKTIIYPREKWGGIWGRALIEKKTLYANEGLHVPEGHVPITKVLVVPIKYGDQVIGLLEVANKSTDYSQKDQEFLEIIAGKIAPILNARLQRDIAEEDLRKYQHNLEELVDARTKELTNVIKLLRQEIKQRRHLEKALLDVSEREQRRIGQELHDSIGQQFTGIAFMTKVLGQKLASKSPEEAASVEEIAKLVNQTMDQTRGLAKVLHPVDLDAGSLVSALQELALTTENLFGIRCAFECDKPIPIDDAEVAVHLYRITQEAVTNAIKHGRAKNIHIGLIYGKKESVLTVKNDGVNFPKEFEKRGTGMGLQIMDHRADIIGGSLNIRSGPKGGTIVTCAFPNKRHKQ